MAVVRAPLPGSPAAGPRGVLRIGVRGAVRIFGLAALLCGAACTLTACFNPQQPGCAFSCASDGLCPSGYSCRADNLCHRDDNQGTCTVGGVTSDAAGDGSGQTGDAASDRAASDGSGAD